MYNTIEVMDLEIAMAQILMMKKGGFYRVSNENVKHVKVLPYLSVVQSVEGSYDIALGNGKSERTGEGGFFIAPSDVQQTIVHHVNPESGKMTCRWLFIDARINTVYKPESLYQFPMVISDERRGELNALFDRLFATNDLWDNYSACYELLGALVRMATPVRAVPNAGVQNAVTYITEHYAESITVKRLAEIANMSESNFFAVFRRYMGNSPLAYINHYRLSIAADRLAETSDTVNEISYSVGIGDPLYFNKLFKKTYGMSPRRYRSMYRVENPQET